MSGYSAYATGSPVPGSQAYLYGPGSHAYTQSAYGYSYSYEGGNGSTYTHVHYVYGGVSVDAHSYVYGSHSYYTSSLTVDKTFLSYADAYAAGYAAPPHSDAYGDLETHQSYSHLSDSYSNGTIYQTRSLSEENTYASGYTVDYQHTGTSEFHGTDFVPGSAYGYSLEVVTNPDGYSTYSSHVSTA